MTGRRSCSRVSETPEIIDGRGVRIYEGRGGSSEASVAFENILPTQNGAAGNNGERQPRGSVAKTKLKAEGVAGKRNNKSTYVCRLWDELMVRNARKVQEEGMAVN